MLKQSYVYLWLRNDGTPYYVGKGTGRRGFINNQHSVHRPTSTDRIIAQEYETEQEAFQAEAFFISFFGRIDDSTGCLRNHTIGGLGGSRGVKPYSRTEQHRRQLSARMIGNRASVGKQNARGRLRTMTADQRSAQARKAAEMRWRVSQR